MLCIFLPTSDSQWLKLSCDSPLADMCYICPVVSSLDAKLCSPQCVIHKLFLCFAVSRTLFSGRFVLCSLFLFLEVGAPGQYSVAVFSSSSSSSGSGNTNSGGS